MPPQIRIKDGGGTLRTVNRIRMRDDSGTLRTVQRIRVRDGGGVLRTVFQYLLATLSPTSVSGTASTSTITTGACTVTVTGGTAPYAYAWTSTGEYADGVSATSPISSSTTFRRPGCISGDNYLGRFFCTVTDATGTAVDSDPVSVSITRT